jgi:hypothetical protein
MNKLKDLNVNYCHEYASYQRLLEEYESELKKYQSVLSWNQRANYYIAQSDPYKYFNDGGTGCGPYYLKNIPPMPSPPALMEHPSDVDVYKYYKVEKFVKGWMLNVSPNWKGMTITREQINFFKSVIDIFYENCNRFIRMDWVLENGHGRDHLHAHIVFLLNTKKPGYMTPIKKGKILTEFRNCWNRLAKELDSDWTIDDEWIDPVDLCKNRCALNTCLLTTPEMLQDKLDYLVEDLKPESHKNDSHHLCPLRGSRGYD